MSGLTISGGMPIKITGTTATDQEILDQQVFIKFVYWFNPTSVGDLFILKDNAGQEIIGSRCEVNAQSRWFPVYARFNGIRSDNLDSGTLYIYIR